MEVVSVVERDGVDAAAVLGGTETPCHREKGIAFGEAEEDVVVASLCRFCAERADQLAGGVFVIGFEVGDVGVVQGRVGLGEGDARDEVVERADERQRAVVAVDDGLFVRALVEERRGGAGDGDGCAAGWVGGGEVGRGACGAFRGSGSGA